MAKENQVTTTTTHSSKMLLLWHSLATGKGKLFCMLCINRSHFQSENNLVVVANCACPLLSIHSNLRNQLDMDWYCFKIILYMKMKEIFDSLLHKKKYHFPLSYHMYVMNWIFFKKTKSFCQVPTYFLDVRNNFDCWLQRYTYITETLIGIL